MSTDEYEAIPETEWKILATTEITHLTAEEKDYLPRAWDEWLARVRQAAKAEALIDAAEDLFYDGDSDRPMYGHRELYDRADRIKGGNSNE